jgi:hypothetical protein
MTMGAAALAEKQPTPATVAAEMAKTENGRRRRRALAAQDEFERTRHSLVVGGHEIGHVKPTRETEAKLRQDPLVRLIANETLSREQGRAAVEIREVYYAVVAGSLVRAHSLDRVQGGRNAGDTRIDRLHVEHYLPWAVYLGGRGETPALGERGAIPAERGRCPPALPLTIDVVIDGLTLARCDGARGWRNGTACRVLAYALAVYADLAGWERCRDAIGAFEQWWMTRRRSGAADFT